MADKMNRENPVICYDCDDVEIIGNRLYCLKKNKYIFSAKPNWCPKPLWEVVNDSVVRGN